ncbi:MAG TPA: hypothetical protein VGV06_13290 [Methylomirabilota bacterium]|nr:hypothetical protein [Methylomirabilota bacterium]
MRLGEVGREAQRLLELLDGLGVAPLAPQRVAQVLVRLGRAPFQGDRAAKLGDCLVEPTLLHERGAQVVSEVRVGGAQAYRLGVVLGRLGKPTQALEGGRDLVAFHRTVRSEFDAGSQVRQGFADPPAPHELATQALVSVRGRRGPERARPESLGVVPDLDLAPREGAEHELQEQRGHGEHSDAQPGA